MKRQVIELKGQKKTDVRGIVSFVNEFHLKKVKRFYMVENANTKIVRAFHGHMKESKYVFVVEGAILLCLAPLTNKENPSTKVRVEKYILSSDNPKIIYIPPRFANGFKSLKKNSKVLFFSTSTLKQSLQDDYRFPFDYFGKDIWK